MRLRRVAREKALQFLFQHEVNATDNLGAELDTFWAEQFQAMREERGERPPAEGEPSPAPTADEAAIRTFADDLVAGTLTRQNEIDAELSRVMINWSLHRLAAVDRNVLRMAVYEMRFRADIP